MKAVHFQFALLYVRNVVTITENTGKAADLLSILQPS